VEASRGNADPNSTCFYGNGCYFAHSARYSHHYAHRIAVDGRSQWQPGQPCLFQLLLVQVICGKAKVYTGMEMERDLDRMRLTDEFDSVEAGRCRCRCWCL
jgi:hypothetical protein